MSAEHSSNENSMFKIALNLTATCLICGIIIAIVYFFTNPIAQVKAIETKNKTMQELVVNADNFKQIEGKTGWYAAEKSGKTIAYVVPGETKGYGGRITMLIAIDLDGKVMKYEILTHNETPGLGDKVGKEPFKSQFAGKTADKLVVTKDPSNKENIQALTGATISSKAVTKGIKEAVEAVAQFEGGK